MNCFAQIVQGAQQRVNERDDLIVRVVQRKGQTISQEIVIVNVEQEPMSAGFLVKLDAENGQEIREIPNQVDQTVDVKIDL